jgi:WD40 repeat protein
MAPLLPDAALTASADGTVRLWFLGHQAGPALVHTYARENCHSALSDVAWSSLHPARFASVTEDGHVQMWAVGRLTPVFEKLVLGPPLPRRVVLAPTGAGDGGDGAAAHGSASSAQDDRKYDEDKDDASDMSDDIGPLTHPPRHDDHDRLADATEGDGPKHASAHGEAGAGESGGPGAVSAGTAQ